MSLQIKNLRSTVTPRNPDSRNDVGLDPDRRLNRIPLDDKIYDLYVAPSSATEMKAAIVKSIRVVNNTASSAVVINLYYTDNVLNGTMVSMSDCRRRRLSSRDIVLPKGFAYIDESEVTVEAGARIQGSARLESGGSPAATDFVDYVISGVERDVT